MDQLECKDPNQWHVVNLRTIGGKIRHEKRILKGHLNWLVVSYGWNKNRKAKGIKKRKQREKIPTAPLQAIQVTLKSISSPFQVCIMSMK